LASWQEKIGARRLLVKCSRSYFLDQASFKLGKFSTQKFIFYMSEIRCSFWPPCSPRNSTNLISSWKVRFKGQPSLL